jgi:gliding motility-associated-like protein
MNDNFDLTGMNVTKLSIFNRYGREVYSKTNYVDEWHGQTDGDNELPTGTYYYMIESGNGESKTGWIYINREVN